MFLKYLLFLHVSVTICLINRKKAHLFLSFLFEDFSFCLSLPNCMRTRLGSVTVCLASFWILSQSSILAKETLTPEFDWEICPWGRSKQTYFWVSSATQIPRQEGEQGVRIGENTRVSKPRPPSSVSTENQDISISKQGKTCARRVLLLYSLASWFHWTWSIPQIISE